ncbi:MAG: hypothetical protein HYY06_22230 [Deltaproteobacteria bacterium]|nr:hypothetical protein [Deltaproteobacteria bacterium]
MRVGLLAILLAQALSGCEGLVAGNTRDAGVEECCLTLRCAPGQECFECMCRDSECCAALECQEDLQTCVRCACVYLEGIDGGGGGDRDDDGDGFGADGDCDDADPAVNAGAAETCNQIDDDCDGTADDGTCPGQLCCAGGCRDCCDAADCDDGDACTTDSCGADGACSHSGCGGGTPRCCPGVGCRECCSAADCSDGDACTTDSCGADGTCSHAGCGGAAPSCCPGAGCRECCNDGQCSDGDGCTVDSCTAGGTCRNERPSACGNCCVDLCEEAQDGDCATYMRGDCGDFCSALSAIQGASGCADERNEYEDCLSECDDACAADCDGEGEDLARCVGNYCVSRLGNANCQILTRSFDF